MATMVGNQVQLQNGQKITPATGGWYDGQQYWNGSLSAPGVINSNSNQQGAGQAVSPQVVAQTNPANVAYIQKQQATYQPSATSQPLPTPGATVAPSSAVPTSAPASGGGAPAMAAAPTPFDLVGATNAAYNTPEITAANQAVTDSNTELTTRQTALATAQANINDNPFYSEATRVGKSQQLTQQANADMTIIQNKITQNTNQVQSLKADAAVKINAAQGQYNINRQAYQDTLSQFNMVLQAGGLTNASPQDLANYAVSTGIPYSALQSIQQAEQDKNIKTQIIPSTDNNGNVTITAVDSRTGAIISQTSAGDIGGSKKGTGTGTTAKQNIQDTISSVYSSFQQIKGPQGYVSKEDWAKMKAAALDTGGMTSAQFNQQFASYTNPGGAKAGYTYN